MPSSCYGTPIARSQVKASFVWRRIVNYHQSSRIYNQEKPSSRKKTNIQFWKQKKYICPQASYINFPWPVCIDKTENKQRITRKKKFPLRTIYYRLIRADRMTQTSPKILLRRCILQNVFVYESPLKQIIIRYRNIALLWDTCIFCGQRKIDLTATFLEEKFPVKKTKV